MASKTTPDVGEVTKIPVPTGSGSGKVPYHTLFRFADSIDKLLYAISFLSAAANGVVFPSFTFIMGGLMDAFFDPNGLSAAVSRFSLYMFVSSTPRRTATFASVPLFSRRSSHVEVWLLRRSKLLVR